jgi:predicted nucleic acid-binding protein
VIVVSDTSPITALLQIGREGILKDLFSVVAVPRAVEAELLKIHHDLPEFVCIHDVINSTEVTALRLSLDQGESEAIVLAEELQADLLLIDETLGRRVAVARGIHVAGLLGVLILAKRSGLISRVAPIIQQLQSTAGFYVSAEVVLLVLAEAGESID